MIPYYKTIIGKKDTLVKKLNFKRLDMPIDVINSEDGLVVNHEYVNLMYGFTWEDVLHAYNSEKRIIEYADKNSKTVAEFETVLCGISDNENFEYENLGGLEIGIASIVMALSAYGCAPISGCRAHEDTRYVDAPPVGL